MRLASPLLFDLARAVEVQGIGAGERTLDIPPGVLPVAVIPLAQLDTLLFNVLDVQRSSFFQHAGVIRTNQAESIVGVATFGQGLWRMDLEVWYASNFDAFTAAGNGFTVYLGASATSLRHLLRGEPKVGDVQHLRLGFAALLPDDGWVMQLGHFTTGVGQTGHVKLSLWASKLL